jgi:putative cell wall-binding protein
MRQFAVAVAFSLAVAVGGLSGEGMAPSTVYWDGADISGNSHVTITYQDGPLATVSGSVYDTAHPGDAAFLVRISISGPGEQPGGANDFQTGHSFAVPFLLPAGGSFTICVRATSMTRGTNNGDSGNFVGIGCTTVVADSRNLTGGIEPFETDPAHGGFAVDLWTADTWNDSALSVTLSIAHRVVDGNGAAFTDDAWTTTTTTEAADAADISSHPGVRGLKSAHAQIVSGALGHYDATGTYTVCASLAPYGSATQTSIGCESKGYLAITELAPATISASVASPGTTLSVTPATWTPTVNIDYVWERDMMNGGETVEEQGVAATSHAFSAADVGHPDGVVVVASADGYLPLEQRIPVSVTLTGAQTQRLAGADRYQTAVAASQRAFPTGTHPDIVYVASGVTFPDALSAGPAAAAHHQDLLLSDPVNLSGATKAELQRLAPKQIVVVGGVAAVSQAVFDDLRPLAPAVTRVGGADRYATSRAVDDFAFPAGSASHVYLATGAAYPDAESTIGAAAAAAAPVLLTNGGAASADSATIAELKRLGTTQVTIVGGDSAISTGVQASLPASLVTDRVSGTDRYATSEALAQEGYPGHSDAAYIAAGYSYPDALASASIEGSQPGPLFLVPGDCVPVPVIVDLARLGVKDVFILGGTSVVMSQVNDLYACA